MKKRKKTFILNGYNLDRLNCFCRCRFCRCCKNCNLNQNSKNSKVTTTTNAEIKSEKHQKCKPIIKWLFGICVTLFAMVITNIVKIYEIDLTTQTIVLVAVLLLIVIGLVISGIIWLILYVLSRGKENE